MLFNCSKSLIVPNLQNVKLKFSYTFKRIILQILLVNNELYLSQNV